MATLSTGLAPDPTASGRAYGQPGRVMITASLSEECFRELPFTPEAVASRILEDLRPSIHITWHEQDVIFSERAFALDRSDRTLADWLSAPTRT